MSTSGANRPLRVLVVSHCYPPAWNWGGPTKSIGNLATGLRKAGAAIRVITTNADLDRTLDIPLEREDDDIVIRTHRVGWIPGKARRRFAFAPSLGRSVREWLSTADLMVCQGVWTWPMVVAPAAARRHGLPYIVCPRGTMEGGSLATKSFKKRIYFRQVERKNFEGALAVHYASETERMRSAAALGLFPSFVDDNAIEFAPRQPADPDGLRRQHALPAGIPIAGMFARMHPRKNQAMILHALAQSSRPWSLLIFGTDEEGHAATLRKLVQQLRLEDRVRVVGTLGGDELQRAYASVDLTILASVQESFGNVVIEAAAQGTGSLVSRGVALGEFLEAESLGHRIDDGGAESWAAAFDHWAERPDLGVDPDRASAKVRSYFDPETRGRALLEIYRARLLTVSSRDEGRSDAD